MISSTQITIWQSILQFLQRTMMWLWSLDTRSVEILLAMEATRRGWIWLTPSASLDSKVYASLSTIAGVHFWGGLFITIGTLQFSALLINGNWKRSPFLRIICLGLAMTIYLVLAMAFFSNEGTPALQAATAQLLLVIVSAWSIINVSAKAG